MLYLGFLAAILTSISFIPQVYRIWKTNDTSSISLAMFVLFSLGVTLWLVYGYIKNDTAITVANAFTLCMCGYILYKKLKNLTS